LQHSHPLLHDEGRVSGEIVGLRCSGDLEGVGAVCARNAAGLV
jgi:hypothetical protein